MRRKEFLLSACLFAIAAAPSFASVTPEQATEAEYLINSGYSELAAEDVFMQKNRANGKSIEPLYDKNQNGFVKCWKTFWSYLDPARDEVDRIHHDIQPGPSYSDL